MLNSIILFTSFSAIVLNGGRFIFDLSLISVLSDESFRNVSVTILWATLALNGSLGVTSGCIKYYSNRGHNEGINKSNSFFIFKVYVYALIPIFVLCLSINALWFGCQNGYIILIALSLYIYNSTLMSARFGLRFKFAAIQQLIAGIMFILLSGGIYFAELNEVNFAILSISAIYLSIGLFALKNDHFIVYPGLNNILLKSDEILRLREAFLFGFPVVFVGFVYAFMFNADKLIISKFYNPNIYKNFYFCTLILLPVHLIISIDSGMKFPLLYKKILQDNITDVVGGYLLEIKKIFSIISVFSIILAALLLVLWPKFGDIYAMAGLLVITIPAHYRIVMHITLINAMNNHKILISSFVFSLCFLIFIFLLDGIRDFPILILLLLFSIFWWVLCFLVAHAKHLNPS